MSIPSRKSIIEWMGTSQLELGDKAATICRQAMEWSEGADPKPTLETFYEEVVYPSQGQGLFANLDYYRNNRVDVAMKVMDVAMETHGVEYIRSNQDTAMTAEGVEYLNTGDTYAATIMYDLGEGRWLLGTWGGMVEANAARFGEDVEEDSAEYGWFENPDEPVEVFTAKTRGGRYSISVVQLGDDDYRIDRYTRGQSSGTSVGYSAEQARQRLRNEISDSAQYDGINYKVGVDALGVMGGVVENPDFVPPGFQGLFQIYGPVALPTYAVVLRSGPIGYMDVWNTLRDRFPDETPADVLIMLENLAREGAIVELGGDTFGKW
jgi:hypothetical protein